MTTADPLAGALRHPVWFGSTVPGATTGRLTGDVACDLVIIGAGLTGLWAANEALRRDPHRTVVVVEARFVGGGASGQNGGFVSTSLTHGLGHGHAMWPDDMPRLIRLGEENVREIHAFVRAEGIDAGLRWCGKTLIATRAHELPELRALHDLHTHYGLASRLLDRDAMRRDVASPTYLGGLRIAGGGLVDPLALTRGLRDAALRRGATLFENSPVRAVRAHGNRVQVRTDTGSVLAPAVLLATNAFRPLLRGLRSFVLPVWDHVLATEPLTPEQLSSVGWAENQGLTDAGNQFHYYRRTHDDRILWGGYDAVYYFGGRTDPGLAQRESSHQLLARHFYETFPQLADVRMSHRWAGIIDTTSRFTPMFGTAMRGMLAYAVGYTGLGVASSRFGALVGLDLVDGRRSERTDLALVRKRPFPFPPEPLRWPAVRVTSAAMSRQDRTGRRGPWLRTLDRLGIGFDS